MGIISGFISGSGKGMAQAGQMMFTDKIAKEREEANFLRDSALKGSMAVEEREFKSAEAEKRDVAAMERTKYTADVKATAATKKDGRTTNIKDAAELVRQGYPKDIANAIAHGAMKQIEDKETGDETLINSLTGKEVGRLTTSGKKKVWLQAGEELENAPIESPHRKQAKAEAEKKDAFWGGEKDPFSETGGDNDAWINMLRHQIANEELADKKG